MANTRVYVVLCPDGSRRMIEAASGAQAIRHVVKDKYSAHAATQKDFVQAMNDGLRVEKARTESPEAGEQLELPIDEATNGNQAETNKEQM